MTITIVLNFYVLPINHGYLDFFIFDRTLFLYPINIFLIVNSCKYNLVEKIFATHIIKM
jgi:hypothetical protein